MARQRKHKPYRSRRSRFGLFYKLLSAAAVLVAVVVACVVFFRVNNIEVVGNKRYTALEVIEASGIQMGDNLITMPKSRVASSILNKLPYVEAVNPQRVLPDSVILRITERVAAASVDSAEGRWLISSGGWLLEEAGNTRAIQVKGLTALTPYAGRKVQVEEGDEATLRYVLELLTALEDHGMLDDCGVLDCTPLTYMDLEYGLYLLRVPRDGDYNYIVQFLAQALNSGRIPEGMPGMCDFTIEDGRMYFQQKDWTVDRGPISSPDPAPTETAEGDSEPSVSPEAGEQ